MAKPATQDGYSDAVTKNCERVLVTLLRGLGPWKKSVYLVGGLVPRYLIPDRPPVVPPHAGTGDVDIVVGLEMLTETNAYHTIEDNLRKMGFERATNVKGEKVSWRWSARIDAHAVVVLELLADNPELSGGKVRALPTEGGVSALNIPHASMVFDHHDTIEVTAELLGENGMAIEKVAFADLVGFVCLKALAYDDRHERKDAHDIVYCIEHWRGGPEAAAEPFRSARHGKHGAVVQRSLDILAARFADGGETADTSRTVRWPSRNSSKANGPMAAHASPEHCGREMSASWSPGSLPTPSADSQHRGEPTDGASRR